MSEAALCRRPVGCGARTAVPWRGWFAVDVWPNLQLIDCNMRLRNHRNKYYLEKRGAVVALILCMPAKSASVVFAGPIFTTQNEGYGEEQCDGYSFNTVNYISIYRIGICSVNSRSTSTSVQLGIPNRVQPCKTRETHDASGRSTALHWLDTHSIQLNRKS